MYVERCEEGLGSFFFSFKWFPEQVCWPLEWIHSQTVSVVALTAWAYVKKKFRLSPRHFYWPAGECQGLKNTQESVRRLELQVKCFVWFSPPVLEPKRVRSSNTAAILPFSVSFLYLFLPGAVGGFALYLELRQSCV